MLKSLRELKKNAIESKKEKNIKDQKLKIKSKIKDIINEKIEINFEEFLWFFINFSLLLCDHFRHEF